MPVGDGAGLRRLGIVNRTYVRSRAPIMLDRRGAQDVRNIANVGTISWLCLLAHNDNRVLGLGLVGWLPERLRFIV